MEYFVNFISKRFITKCFYIFAIQSYVFCNVNLFLDENQVTKILGYDAQLFFLRNGVENHNAIRYQLPIPSHIEEINMKWQNLYPPFHVTKLQSSSKPQPIFMFYSMALSSGDITKFKQPFANIKPTGSVPQTESSFSISTICEPNHNDAVSFYVNINITVIDPSIGHNQSIKVNFHFKKICQHGIDAPTTIIDPTLPPEEVSQKNDVKVEQTNVFYIGMGVACSVFLILATTVAVLHVHSMPKPNTNKDTNSHSDSTSQIGSTIPRSHPSHSGIVPPQDKFKRDARLKLRDVVIPRSLVSLGNVVQEGAFGRVFLGALFSNENGEEQRVFVKTVTEQASLEQVNVFLSESVLLKRVNHRNVQPVMHVCLEEGFPPMVVLPYMNRGSLKNYLRLSRTAEPLSKTLTTRDIVYMAIQIARGLQFLAKRKITHRDVAARNCVIDDELNVKVSDNALARDFFPGDYHCLGDNENRPIRWMAVEAIEFKKYAVASDVWSYGVLLWELTTLAQTPYSNVDPSDMLRYLKSGLRLPQPSNCPDDLFTVMACCWALSGEERPQFAQIGACLEGFYDTLNAFI